VGSHRRMKRRASFWGSTGRKSFHPNQTKYCGCSTLVAGRPFNLGRQTRQRRPQGREVYEHLRAKGWGETLTRVKSSTVHRPLEIKTAGDFVLAIMGTSPWKRGFL